jgi:hypothetical protein
LLKNYNEDAADKKFYLENTSRFIANRLALITEEDPDESKMCKISKKTPNQLTDIETEAAFYRRF